jgi:hypothetical protein
MNFLVPASSLIVEVINLVIAIVAIDVDSSSAFTIGDMVITILAMQPFLLVIAFDRDPISTITAPNIK